MSEQSLTKYARVYYTGDRANADGHGCIVDVKPNLLTVELDDGRTFRVMPIEFRPAPGRRFMLRYEREREYAAEMFKAYGTVTCTVHASPYCWQPDGPADAARKECGACYDTLSA